MKIHKVSNFKGLDCFKELDWVYKVNTIEVLDKFMVNMAGIRPRGLRKELNKVVVGLMGWKVRCRLRGSMDRPMEWEVRYHFGGLISRRRGGERPFHRSATSRMPSQGLRMTIGFRRV